MSEISYRKLFDLHGKTAIVTGGAGILGRRFCAGLAEFGANVAVIDIDNRAAEEVAGWLVEQYGVKSIGIGCDITMPDSVKEMLEQAVSFFSNIHILHNNAVGKSNDPDAFFASFEEYSLKQWREIMAINIDGMFLVAQTVGKHMLEHGEGGSIIQTSSIYGIMAPDQRIYEGSFYLGRSINTPAVYSTSKAAVIGLTKYLATYWADKGIRVNTLTPGGVESGQNETFKQNYSARVPLGRMAKSDEMVSALVYLASGASSYVTGQNLIVDGGLECW
jgi:NAD(P)-dependent dehydrogenase (short-subunit alcohol dehydrogenase family)